MKYGKILVIGGGGFLGKSIVRMLLSRREEVRVFGRNVYPGLEALGVECVQGDLRNPEDVKRAVTGSELVFHTAAKAGIWGKRVDFMAVNTEGTRNVINACRECGVSRLVFTSSPSVVFGKDDIVLGDESLPYPENFLAPYPESKAKAEKLVLQANCKKLATCALRPHLIWGPDDPHIIPRLIQKARRRKLMQVGDGVNLVDITYVENAAHAHLLAADRLLPGSPVAGNAYFIGDENPVNLWDWINNVLFQAGVRQVNQRIKLSDAMVLGAILEFFHKYFLPRTEPKMTRFVALQLAKSHYFSHKKAQNDFGYTPIVSNQQGIKRLIAWLKAEHLV